MARESLAGMLGIGSTSSSSIQGPTSLAEDTISTPKGSSLTKKSLASYSSDEIDELFDEINHLQNELDQATAEKESIQRILTELIEAKDARIAELEAKLESAAAISRYTIAQLNVCIVDSFILYL